MQCFNMLLHIQVWHKIGITQIKCKSCEKTFTLDEFLNCHRIKVYCKNNSSWEICPISYHLWANWNWTSHLWASFWPSSQTRVTLEKSVTILNGIVGFIYHFEDWWLESKLNDRLWMSFSRAEQLKLHIGICLFVLNILLVLRQAALLHCTNVC